MNQQTATATTADIPTDSDSFLEELTALQRQFEDTKPELELTVRDPALGVEGYVIVWNTIADSGNPLGRCGKGGTRITPAVSIDEIRMLAKKMALKNAAANLPLGGAKSGLRADPEEPDFERKYRRFVSLVKPILRENGGIFGGFGFDIGARPEHPHWACDELQSYRSFTGKPVEMGGTDYDVEGHAGLGVAVAARTLLELDGKSPHGLTFAVQGGGAMGAAVIRYFSEFGARLQSISGPICGATFKFEEQLPATLIESLSHRDHETSCALLKEHQYPTEPMENIIYQDVDVLFPCAVQEVITEENAHLIKARMVVEGANGPCTDRARTILHERGIQVIPDIAANPGGIIAAFVELTSRVSPEENVRTRQIVEEAKSLTRSKVRENVERIFQVVGRFNVEPALAAQFYALRNMARGNATGTD